MSQIAILERKSRSMKLAEEDLEVAQILDRLDKLSKPAENPGVAYRNLDTIAALVHTLRGKLSLPALDA